MARPVIKKNDHVHEIDFQSARRRVKESFIAEFGTKFGTVNVVILEPENPVTREEVAGNRAGLDGVLKNLSLKVNWPDPDA